MFACWPCATRATATPARSCSTLQRPAGSVQFGIVRVNLDYCSRAGARRDPRRQDAVRPRPHQAQRAAPHRADCVLPRHAGPRHDGLVRPGKSDREPALRPAGVHPLRRPAGGGTAGGRGTGMHAVRSRPGAADARRMLCLLLPPSRCMEGTSPRIGSSGPGDMPGSRRPRCRGLRFTRPHTAT